MQDLSCRHRAHAARWAGPCALLQGEILAWHFKQANTLHRRRTIVFEMRST